MGYPFNLPILFGPKAGLWQAYGPIKFEIYFMWIYLIAALFGAIYQLFI